MYVIFQHTSMNPDGKLLAIVGDDPDGMLVDSTTGKVRYSYSTTCLETFSTIVTDN